MLFTHRRRFRTYRRIQAVRWLFFSVRRSIKIFVQIRYNHCHGKWRWVFSFRIFPNQRFSSESHRFIWSTAYIYLRTSTFGSSASTLPWSSSQCVFLFRLIFHCAHHRVVSSAIKRIHSTAEGQYTHTHTRTNVEQSESHSVFAETEACIHLSKSIEPILPLASSLPSPPLISDSKPKRHTSTPFVIRFLRCGIRETTKDKCDATRRVMRRGDVEREWMRARKN